MNGSTFGQLRSSVHADFGSSLLGFAAIFRRAWICPHFSGGPCELHANSLAQAVWNIFSKFTSVQRRRYHDGYIFGPFLSAPCGPGASSVGAGLSRQIPVNRDEDWRPPASLS